MEFNPLVLNVIAEKAKSSSHQVEILGCLAHHAIDSLNIEKLEYPPAGAVGWRETGPYPIMCFSAGKL